MSGEKAYSDWHWGIAPTQTVRINPPQVVTSGKDKKKWEKMNLIECGRLVEIHYAPFDKSIKRKEQIIRLNQKNSNECHLCFDMDHPSQRLYFILNDATKNRMKNEMYLKNPLQEITLAELAAQVGGRHATDDYEDIQINPIGIMTNVVYACEKKDDGYSFYIHSLGEESGIRPALGVAKDGSLWFAGGNYTSPIQGITD